MADKYGAAQLRAFCIYYAGRARNLSIIHTETSQWHCAVLVSHGKQKAAVEGVHQGLQSHLCSTCQVWHLEEGRQHEHLLGRVVVGCDVLQAGQQCLSTRS